MSLILSWGIPKHNEPYINNIRIYFPFQSMMMKVMTLREGIAGK